MDLGLKSLKAIVTGGTRGIGMAIVNRLVEEGVQVAFCARDANAVKSRVAELNQAGAKAHELTETPDRRPPFLYSLDTNKSPPSFHNPLHLVEEIL